MTAQQRIERIAWNVANLLADQYQNSRPVSLAGETPKPVAIVIAAITEFAEEQKGEQEQFKQFILTELDKIYHVKAGTNAERIAASIIHAIYQRCPNQSTGEKPE